jgi:hypothetical protein
MLSHDKRELSWVRALRSDPVITARCRSREEAQKLCVIKDGNVVGSLPLAEGGGYTGSIAAH